MNQTATVELESAQNQHQLQKTMAVSLNQNTRVPLNITFQLCELLMAGKTSSALKKKI